MKRSYSDTLEKLTFISKLQYLQLPTNRQYTIQAFLKIKVIK